MSRQFDSAVQLRLAQLRERAADRLTDEEKWILLAAPEIEKRIELASVRESDISKSIEVRTAASAQLQTLKGTLRRIVAPPGALTAKEIAARLQAFAGSGTSVWDILKIEPPSTQTSKNGVRLVSAKKGRRARKPKGPQKT